MRKVILAVAISLDGFIEGPNGEYDWCTIEKGFSLKEFFRRIDSIFIGRKTYEMYLAMEGGPPGFPKFKEYIFSSTRKKVKEGSTLINGDTKTEVEKIKNEKGKDIWLFGGAALTTSLMNLGS
jgi:dihydrofolate reductase